jgi:hypothetical protein
VGACAGCAVWCGVLDCCGTAWHGAVQGDAGVARGVLTTTLSHSTRDCCYCRWRDVARDVHVVVMPAVMTCALLCTGRGVDQSTLTSGTDSMAIQIEMAWVTIWDSMGSCQPKVEEKQ